MGPLRDDESARPGRWGLLLWLALAGMAACSTDEGHFITPSSVGRGVVLVREGADLDARASFLDSELVFWEHHSSADVLAAFLDKPFDGSPSPRLIESAGHAQAFTAAADTTGRICLAGLRYYEDGLTTITASLSKDRGVSWSEPQVVHHERDELAVFDPDSLVAGRPGEWYLLVRYRRGLVPKGLLFRVYGFRANQWVLRGLVPGTDDLSSCSTASLAVSNDGRLAVAFITHAGTLRVLESADGGQSWVNLGAPARLRVPGLRIPFINPPFIAEPPRVTEAMPSVRWAAGNWALVWETHVATLRGVLMTWDNYVDTLFSRHDRRAGKWTATVCVSDRRTVARTTMPPLNASMQALEIVSREARGPELRYPHLAVAATGRLAIFWSELRDERIAPVASLSNDGGASWSRPVMLERTGRNDTDGVRGAFDPDGNIRAVYRLWPGRISLMVPGGIGLKASELLLHQFQ